MNSSLTQKQTELLDQALRLAHSYRRLEAEICLALREIDRTKLYKKIGHRSLFQYVSDRLGFSAAVAYAFVSVTRKSAVIPELQAAIESKHLSVAKASRIVSSLNSENATLLIQFAQAHSCRETEREIARLNPKAARPDRVKAVAENLNEIQGTISDQVNEKLKRAESLLAQKGKATDFNSVLEAALDEYLKHHDPVKKAARGIARREKSKAESHSKPKVKLELESKSIFTTSAKEKSDEKSNLNLKAESELLRTRKKKWLDRSVNRSFEPPVDRSLVRSLDLSVDHCRETDHSDSTPIHESENASATVTKIHSGSFSVAKHKRVPLTAEQRHFVFHRDQGRCTHLDEMGKRCGSDRWVDLHHFVEVSRGGTNEPSNLTVLCSFHHDLVHQLSLPLDDGQFNWLREPRVCYS